MNNNLTPKAGSPALVKAEMLLNNQASASLEEIRQNVELYPRLKSVDPVEAVKALTILTSTAFTIRGQRPDATTLSATASILYDTLMEDEERIGTRNITFPELTRIIKRSALTVDAPVSVATLYTSIKSYCVNEGHRLEDDIRRKQKKADFGDFLDAHPEYAGKIRSMFKDFGK